MISHGALSLEVGRVFTPTAPVDEKSLFAGRREQISLVLDAVGQKGQHAILFGERGVGKTSLANVLHSFLSTSRFVIARVNCDSADTLESLFRKAFRELTITSQKRGIGFTGELTPVSANAEQLLAEDVSADSIRKALDFLSESILIIMIFDEFDRLGDGVKHAVADTLKGLSDHAVAATVLLVGVADDVSDLIREHASIERALSQIRMPRMSSEEIREIILKGVRRLEVTMTEAVRERIVVLSQGLPHFTHLLCLYAVRSALDRGSIKVDLQDLDSAISKSLRNTQHSIQSSYHTATMSPRKDNLFADVLLACALAPTDEMGYFAAQDVREPIRGITGKAYEIPSFSQHLKEFTELKRGPILQKIGSARRFRFRFINPLLPPYIVMKGYSDGKVFLVEQKDLVPG